MINEHYKKIKNNKNKKSDICLKVFQIHFLLFDVGFFVRWHEKGCKVGYKSLSS